MDPADTIPHKRQSNLSLSGAACFSNEEVLDLEGSLSVVVIGASGDLAKKKTFPALFKLYSSGLLPKHINIAGFARRPIEQDTFHKDIVSKYLKSDSPKLDAFLERCFYHQGQYKSAEDFAALSEKLDDIEKKTGGEKVANRIFYMAIPPSVFYDSAKSLKEGCMSSTGWNRVVVEKPFGKDTKSALKLEREISSVLTEEQVYRIDHYLGKEMVQNLLTVRFANSIFEPIWNSFYISSVLITFKENFGTGGRGGYFDQFGIIRDVMQNHLTQILALVAMEPPVTLTAEDVRDEKVKLLRAIPPILREDVVLGQYGPASDGSEPSYLDDKTVPDESVTPTFATALLYVNNTRWKGVPFIMRAGKGLNERKAEIRIQFRDTKNGLFPNSQRNELVIRVQPDEAVYCKMMTKKPGLSSELILTELDLSYGSRFELSGGLPDAYERLILDVARGDHNLFVRGDELLAAWEIFTPLLHEIEAKRDEKPILYEFGSRGPKKADELISKAGYIKSKGYHWPGTGKL